MTTLSRTTRGFTLIEIISVLVILGILASVAVPKYFDLQAESEKKAALSAVAEAQARLQLSFGQQILQGKTCEDALNEVNEIKLLSDDGASSLFGEFFLGTDESVSGGQIAATGSPVYAKRGDDGTVIKTGASLYLPLCGEDGSLASNFPETLLGYLDRVLQENAHDFRDDIVNKPVSLENGVEYTVTNIVNQGKNGAYIDFQYVNSGGDKVTFQVHKTNDGKTWIQQMIVHPKNEKGINLIKDNYRPDLNSNQIERAKNIVSGMGLNVGDFGPAFNKDYGTGVLYF